MKCLIKNIYFCKKNFCALIQKVMHLENKQLKIISQKKKKKEKNSF